MSMSTLTDLIQSLGLFALAWAFYYTTKSQITILRLVMCLVSMQLKIYKN